jgi:hypothetical protein
MSIFQKLSNRLDDPQEAHKSSNDYLDYLFSHYKDRLLKETNLDQLIKLPDYQKRKTIEKLIADMLEEEKVIIAQMDKAKLLEMILNDSVGYGPLEPLLHDDEITEIMVNAPDEVYIERNGNITLNTGHEGSLTTVHANSPQDAMSRLEAMILMSNPSMTAEVIRPYISAAIHLVAQTLRLSDGTRKIVSIAEVVSEDEDLKLKEIFRFVRQGVEVTGQVIGYFTATGYVPDCVHRLKTFGHELPADLFRPEEGAVSRVG